jgi:hypothetical protein
MIAKVIAIVFAITLTSTGAFAQVPATAELKPGHVIGTALALTGEPSPVDATFTDTARYMCWPLNNIRSFLDKRPALRVTLQSLVNRDLAGKLQGLLST